MVRAKPTATYTVKHTHHSMTFTVLLGSHKNSRYCVCGQI